MRRWLRLIPALTALRKFEEARLPRYFHVGVGSFLRRRSLSLLHISGFTWSRCSFDTLWASFSFCLYIPDASFTLLVYIPSLAV